MQSYRSVRNKDHDSKIANGMESLQAMVLRAVACNFSLMQSLNNFSPSQFLDKNRLESNRAN